MKFVSLILLLLLIRNPLGLLVDNPSVFLLPSCMSASCGRPVRFPNISSFFSFSFASLERISPLAASDYQHPGLLLYSIHLLPCSKNVQHLNGCFAPKQAKGLCIHLLLKQLLFLLLIFRSVGLNLYLNFHVVKS